ncbi:hypothetical protein D3C78_754650 [compost metagenome]
MLVHYLPEARGVRVVGYAFEHQRDRAIGQGAIDDVAVAGDPADIGGAPEHLAVTVVEHHLEGEGGLQQVAAGSVQHALGFAGAAGGVEDEQRVFGAHRLGSAVVAGLFRCLVVPEVTAFGPDDIAASAAHHEYAADLGATGQGLVDVLFQRDAFAAAHAFIGGDYRTAVGIEDTVAQGIGGEAAEHHRVDGTDAGAGKHGEGGLGDHRHVDAHPVAFLHPACFQRIGQAADLAVQFAVGDGLGILGVIAFPQQSGLFAASGQVAVDAVVADVELGAVEPAGAAGLQVALLHARPGFDPVQALGLFGPEGVGVVHRLAVEAAVLVGGEGGGLADGQGLGVVADIEHGGWSCSCKGRWTATTIR